LVERSTPRETPETRSIVALFNAATLETTIRIAVVWPSFLGGDYDLRLMVD
jgi:hypothetical protein